MVAALAIHAATAVKDRGWGVYLKLMQHGAHCEATIVKAETQGRCLAEYTYSIGGRSYLGSGSQCGLKAGEHVVITYLVADPSSSCLGYAGERLANDVASYFFGGLSFPEVQ